MFNVCSLHLIYIPRHFFNISNFVIKYFFAVKCLLSSWNGIWTHVSLLHQILSLARLAKLRHPTIQVGGARFELATSALSGQDFASIIFIKIRFGALPNWAIPRKRQERDLNSRATKYTGLAVRQNWSPIWSCHSLFIGGSWRTKIFLTLFRVMLTTGLEPTTSRSSV